MLSLILYRIATNQLFEILHHLRLETSAKYRHHVNSRDNRRSTRGHTKPRADLHSEPEKINRTTSLVGLLVHKSSDSSNAENETEISQKNGPIFPLKATCHILVQGNGVYHA